MFEFLSIAYNNASGAVLSKLYEAEAKRLAKKTPYVIDDNDDSEPSSDIPKYHIRSKLTKDAANAVNAAGALIENLLRQVGRYDDNSLSRIVDMFKSVYGAEVEPKYAHHYLKVYHACSDADIEMYESAMKTICSSKQFVEMIETEKQ